MTSHGLKQVSDKLHNRLTRAPSVCLLELHCITVLRSEKCLLRVGPSLILRRTKFKNSSTRVMWKIPLNAKTNVTTGRKKWVLQNQDDCQCSNPWRNRNRQQGVLYFRYGINCREHEQMYRRSPSTKRAVRCLWTKCPKWLNTDMCSMTSLQLCCWTLCITVWQHHASGASRKTWAGHAPSRHFHALSLTL
jgi:hypothetical protein